MIASVFLNLLKSCSVLQPLCRAPDRKLRYAEFVIASIEPLGQLELRQNIILQKFETFKYSI